MEICHHGAIFANLGLDGSVTLRVGLDPSAVGHVCGLVSLQLLSLHGDLRLGRIFYGIGRRDLAILVDFVIVPVEPELEAQGEASEDQSRSDDLDKYL